MHKIKIRSMGLGVAAVVLVAAGMVTGQAQGTQAAKHAATPDRKRALDAVPRVIHSALGNWDLVYDDEFTGAKGSAPNPKDWTYDTGNNGGWGNNEEEDYTSSRQNSFLTGNGTLAIVARKQSLDGYEYTSARLVSKRSFRYGYIEVEAKLPPGGQGIWPAIWLLPTNWTYGDWPASGEIDMLEAINHMSQVHGDLHYGTPSTPDLGVWFPSNLSAGFHNYAIKWDPDRIRFYVDHQLYLTFTSDQWTSSSVGPTPAPFDQPFHLIMNIATGGNWPGEVAKGTTFPQEMQIRYVRVYQRSNAYAWPVPGTIQADRTFARSAGLRISDVTDDLTYDPNVVPTPPDNLSLAPDHALWFQPATGTVSYRIHVPSTGMYTMSLRVESDKPGAMTYQVDSKIRGLIHYASTAGWETFSSERIRLTAGDHTVQFAKPTTKMGLHYVQFTHIG